MANVHDFAMGQSASADWLRLSQGIPFPGGRGRGQISFRSARRHEGDARIMKNRGPRDGGAGRNEIGPPFRPVLQVNRPASRTPPHCFRKSVEHLQETDTLIGA